MTDESPLWHHFSADFQMPICDLFHLWVIFFFHCPWALRSIELPMAGQSNTETAADLHRRIMFPESRVWYCLTCFNTELWLILPSLFCMHFQIRPEMMRLVTKWRSLLHLLLIPQITFVEIYSLSATAGTNSTYVKTVHDVGHREKIWAVCLNISCVYSLICLFLFVWWVLLSRCACPTLASLFCSSHTLHFKWHAVFN